MDGSTTDNRDWNSGIVVAADPIGLAVMKNWARHASMWTKGRMTPSSGKYWRNDRWLAEKGIESVEKREKRGAHSPTWPHAMSMTVTYILFCSFFLPFPSFFLGRDA